MISDDGAVPFDLVSVRSAMEKDSVPKSAEARSKSRNREFGCSPRTSPKRDRLWCLPQWFRTSEFLTRMKTLTLKICYSRPQPGAT